MTRTLQAKRAALFRFWAFLLTLPAVKLALSAGLRAWGLMNDPYDDAMLVKNAAGLISGDWLGPYDQYTLAKGVTFPLYLAFLHQIGLPYLAANVLLCFASSLLFILVIRRLIPNRAALCAIYAVLMFNPIAFASWTFNRVYRDSLYSYLVVLLFSFLIGIYLYRKESVARLVFFSAGAGFSLALAWLAREDTAWVLPFTGAALLITACFLLFDRQVRQKIGRLAALMLVPALLAAGILTVSQLNYRYYRVHATTELSGGALPRLVRELSAIQPDQWRPRCSIPESSRQKAYAVSSTFSKIRPVLENHPFVLCKQKNPSCQMLVWSMLDSVEWSGIRDGASSQEFYEKSAEEIGAAIRSGKIPSRGGYVHMFVSPWDNRYLLPMLRDFGITIRMTVFMNNYDRTPLNAENIATQGTPEMKNVLAGVVRGPITFEDSQIPVKDPRIGLINGIALLYSRLNPFVTALGLLCYLYILLRFLLSARARKFALLDPLLISTGLLLSCALRLLLISYTDVSAEESKYAMYLGPCYWLLPMAVCLCIGVAAFDFAKRWSRLNGKKNPPAGKTAAPKCPELALQ